MTVYRRLAYEVRAEKMGNGNWLVETSDGRREVWYPAEFAAAFEPVTPTPAYQCPGCGNEMVYDTSRRELLCGRGCLGE
jgi:hypothetical protein